MLCIGRINLDSSVGTRIDCVDSAVVDQVNVVLIIHISTVYGSFSPLRFLFLCF